MPHKTVPYITARRPLGKKPVARVEWSWTSSELPLRSVFVQEHTVTEAEFSAILDDPSKTIEGDIDWRGDEDHSPTVEFRVEVASGAGWPLTLCVSYNGLAQTLTYALIHRGTGRIYALDLGKEHRNPTGELVGEKHKHRWTERFRDKEAYAPLDITASADDPVEVWGQFCKEAKVTHRGALRAPPSTQGILE
jgi:hypothetical protein